MEKPWCSQSHRENSTRIELVVNCHLLAGDSQLFQSRRLLHLSPGADFICVRSHTGSISKIGNKYSSCAGRNSPDGAASFRNFPIRPGSSQRLWVSLSVRDMRGRTQCKPPEAWGCSGTYFSHDFSLLHLCCFHVLSAKNSKRNINWPQTAQLWWLCKSTTPTFKTFHWLWKYFNRWKGVFRKSKNVQWNTNLFRKCKTVDKFFKNMKQSLCIFLNFLGSMIFFLKRTVGTL